MPGASQTDPLLLFTNRDTLIYAVSAESSGLPQVVELLSEVVLRPKIAQEEVGLNNEKTSELALALMEPLALQAMLVLQHYDSSCISAFSHVVVRWLT